MKSPRSLCDVANSFPDYISVMLQRENALRRGRFCEETFTDLLTATMIPFAGERVQIAYPDEPQTGGDIDFIFDNARTGRTLTVRVQAKRLNQQFEGTFRENPGASKAKTGRENRFENRCYRELLHVVKGSGHYQYETLVADRTVVPLYAFYNHRNVVQEAQHLGYRTVCGVNLAFADKVKEDLDKEKIALAETPQRRPGYKKLVSLSRLFFGLDVLLCPRSEALEVPTPEDVAQRLREIWNARYSGEQGELDARLSAALDAEGQSVASRSYVTDPIAVSRQIHRTTIRLVSGTGDDPDGVDEAAPIIVNPRLGIEKRMWEQETARRSRE